MRPQEMEAGETATMSSTKSMTVLKHFGLWLAVLTCLSLGNLAVVLVVAYQIRGWPGPDWKWVGLATLLMSTVNAAGSSIALLLSRRALLRHWVGVSSEEVLAIDSHRMHLPGSWLQDLLARTDVKWKIKIIDSLTRKGQHLWINGLNYIILVPCVFRSDRTAEVLVGGTLVVTFAHLARTLVLLCFRGPEQLWSWRYLAFLFSASDRIRDGRLAQLNLMVAGISSNYGILAAFALATACFPSDSEAPNLWKLGTQLVTLPLTFGDMMGELIGAPFGRHTFKVWGMGEINQKSWEGCFAVFAGSLIPCLVATFTLPGEGGKHLHLATQIGLPVTIALVTMVAETFSFRSTDNFTIVVACVLVVIVWRAVFSL